MSVAPKHVAVIMDGNGRWAKKRFMPRVAGHRAGRNAARKAIKYCVQHADIDVLTLFAFSTENWSRPEDEVNGLMELFATALNDELPKLQENGIRLRFIGDWSRFSNKLQAQMHHSQEVTATGRRLTVQLALNYGGRAEIVRASRQLAEQVKAGALQPEAITEETIASHLYSRGVPDPDLFIRTGGESRISNFLLWGLAYSELYFSATLWPDFDEAAMQEAVDWFATRQRRFGKTGEQLG